MSIRDEIATRRIALIRELGFNEGRVLRGSFDETGFEVLGEDPRGTLVPPAYEEMLRTRVPWPDEDWKARAATAMREDFEEMVGPELASSPELAYLRGYSDGRADATRRA